MPNRKFLKVYHAGYQTWRFDTTSPSKLFIILILSVFDLQQSPATSMQWRPKCRLNRKFLKVDHVGYQTWWFDTTNTSKLFIILILSVFDLQYANWWGASQNYYSIGRSVLKRHSASAILIPATVVPWISSRPDKPSPCLSHY